MPMTPTTALKDTPMAILNRGRFAILESPDVAPGRLARLHRASEFRGVLVHIIGAFNFRGERT